MGLSCEALAKQEEPRRRFTGDGEAMRPNVHRWVIAEESVDISMRLHNYVFMRTTIDLPEDLFREVKLRAVKEGTTLKGLLTECIRSGLRGQAVGRPAVVTRRGPPPVAIRRIAEQELVRAKSNRQLNEILEAEEVKAVRATEFLRREGA